MGKLYISLFMLLLVSITVYGQTGCTCGDCDTKFGVYVWSSGDKYVGEYSGGYRTGYGCYYYPSGSKFFGQYSSNLPSGYGIYKFSNGDLYIGQWKENKRTGYGYFKYADGTVNLGSFTEGTFNSYSSISSGSCVSGNCTNGDGIYLFSSGEQYNGKWKNDKRNGYGTNIFTDGTLYRGDWVDDIRSGYGMQQYNESSEFFLFCGALANDKPTSGRMTYKDGKNFLGGYVNGLPDGSGTMTYCDGSTLNGYWKAGKYAGSTYNDYTNYSDSDYDYDDYDDLLDDYTTTDSDREIFSWTNYNMQFEIPKDLTVNENNSDAFSASNSKVNFSIYPRAISFTDDTSIKNELKRWAKENQLTLEKEPNLLDEELDYKRYMATTLSGDHIIGCMIMIDKEKTSQAFYVWISVISTSFDEKYIGFIDTFKKINKEPKAPKAPVAPVRP